MERFSRGVRVSVAREMNRATLRLQTGRPEKVFGVIELSICELSLLQVDRSAGSAPLEEFRRETLGRL